MTSSKRAAEIVEGTVSSIWGEDGSAPPPPIFKKRKKKKKIELWGNLTSNCR